MSIFKCMDCGAEIEEESLDTYRECVGEFWGDPAYQEFYCCPFCESSDLEEMEECKNCGTPFIPNEEECYEGYCPTCKKEIVETYKYDIDSICKVWDKIGQKDSVELNGFLATEFSSSEIEEILKRELKEAQKYHPKDYSDDIVESIDDFADMLY